MLRGHRTVRRLPGTSRQRMPKSVGVFLTGSSRSPWNTFLKAHGDVLGAIDFTKVEVWAKDGLGLLALPERLIRFIRKPASPRTRATSDVRKPHGRRKATRKLPASWPLLSSVTSGWYYCQAQGAVRGANRRINH